MFRSVLPGVVWMAFAICPLAYVLDLHVPGLPCVGLLLLNTSMCVSVLVGQNV